MVIRDLLSGDATENVCLRILPDLLAAATKHGAVLSVGASFRSANIFDALDEVQDEEIAAQIALADTIRSAGVGVIIEGPGHMKPRDIRRAARILAPSTFPIMPLGPLPTDAAEGFDHVAASIGAVLMGLGGAAHVLAAVSREEHTGAIPSLSSTVEAVRSAQVAGHVIDLELLDATEADTVIAADRASCQSCIGSAERKGACGRCGDACPLLMRRSE